MKTTEINNIKLTMLGSVIYLLEMTQKAVCPACERGDVVNMAGDHGFGPNGPNMGMGQSNCNAKDLRALVQHIRAGVMLKIPRNA